jgi:glucose/arabinose dehydrogenase
MLSWLGVASILSGVVAVGACGGSDENGPSSTATTGAGASGGNGGGTTSSGGGASTSTSTTTSGAGGSGTGGGMAATCPPPPSGPIPALKLTPVATGLSSPIFAGSAPDDDTRLFVIEQPGRIRVVKSGTLLDEAFLDVSALVSCCGEQGLLGVAFHPDYAQNGRFFIDYTNTDGDTVVAEYARSANDPDKAAPAEVKQLFTVGQPFANHNGGNLVFGPDGLLYIGMGDGGSGGDPMGNGQNISVPLGKLLRIDVDTYPTPPPNNLPGGDPRVWDYGLRNPWRFSFDRCTGDLYIGDVGQNAWEEIDVEPAGQGHKNYGWNVTEGTHCYEPMSGCDTSGITLPVAEYPHENGECSVTGGFVYRGTKIPNLVGTYLYGDYCSGRIRTLTWKDGAVTSQGDLTDDLDSQAQVGFLSSFGQDAAGELYVLSHGKGTVFRIDTE